MYGNMKQIDFSPKKIGLPTMPDTVTTWFRKFIDKTDLPPIHIHSLRHINATLMISLGIDIRTVSR